MSSTTFVDNQTVIYASWLNDVNSVVYNGTFQASVVTPSNLVCNGTVSGSGFTSLVNNTLGSPSAIGNVVPNTGAFTTLSSSGAATLNSLSLTTALGKSYGGTGLTSAGTAGNVLTSDGTNWTSVAKITSGTAIATTSGISALFTGIPANVKRITIMFNGFGTNGSSVPWVQIGSGSLSTTGYSALTQAYAGTNTSTTTSTSGFYLSNSNGSSYAWSGAIVLYTLGSNVWVASGFVGSTVGTYSGSVSGSITLGGALDRVSIAASNGTDTLRAGSINILYE